MVEYDFGGWATRNDLRCSDGRTIKKDAFKHNDGKTVPLVWNHQHNEAVNVLGHALLENRPEGVYAYCTFNNTEAGRNAKLLVEHGDISALSIYANQLKQNGGNVMHGEIRELSLVLAGANPGAYIDSIIKHDDGEDEEAIMYTGFELDDIHHSDEEDEEDEYEEEEELDVDDDDEDDEDKLEHACGGKKKKKTLEHSKEGEDDMPTESNDKTVKEVFDTLNEEQKTVVYALIGQALDDNDEGDDENMKHNVFETEENNDTLMHAETEAAIFSDAKRYGSLKESTLQHGIDQIDYLFPDAQAIDGTPQFIQRDMGWVQKVMKSVHHTPFSRIKSIFADITEDDARAKGYIKGKLKKEEVFSLLKRATTPTTVYKKQKLDRDDVVDIKDFDVVAWLKSEMRMMLDEELARAYLVGDGRLASSDDKINEQNIRPVWKDEDLFTIKTEVAASKTDTEDKKAKAFIRAVIKSRKNYKGSGNPTLYTTEDILTDCLLLEDATGRILYDSVEKLATTLRVKEIVTVPVMENLSRTGDDGATYDLMGIVVNLADYNVGADKGGAVNMFDDFDIDYNAQKYLIETRCSAALTKPFSAIALEIKSVGA